MGVRLEQRNLKRGPFPLVVVEWLDAMCKAGWGSTEDHQGEGAVTRHVGWLIKSTDTTIVLAQGIGDDPMSVGPMMLPTFKTFCNTITIPKGMIKTSKVLHEGTDCDYELSARVPTKKNARRRKG
jgi:hypothetical protein